MLSLAKVTELAETPRNPLSTQGYLGLAEASWQVTFNLHGSKI